MELWKTERQATAWRNIDRIIGQDGVWLFGGAVESLIKTE
jgi:hypothetical protein